MNKEDQVSCRLMIAKSKVPPVKMQTIPRFELTGAVLSVKVAGLLQEELEIPIKVLSDRLTRSCWGIFPTKTNDSKRSFYIM